MDNGPWEDNLLERKAASDLKDLLRTLVAFANSVKPGHVATILIGERNDSSVQGVTNPDAIQETVRSECDKVYPPIVWRSQVYERDGKHCVRVEIEFSGETPHFAGPAWVRQGSESVKASDRTFQRLVEIRLDKVSELAKWEGARVLVEGDQAGVEFRERVVRGGHPRWPGQAFAVLESVNAFWVEFNCDGKKRSEPLEKILLAGKGAGDCLRILVKV